MNPKSQKPPNDAAFSITNLSSYLKSTEYMLYVAIIVIALAYFGMSHSRGFSDCVWIFLVLSVALVFIHPLSLFIFSGGKPIKPTDKDMRVVEGLRLADLPKTEKQRLTRIYLDRHQNRNTLIFGGVAWCLLLELFLIFGFAEYLSQFSLAQSLASLIPSDIFLVRSGATRSPYDVLLLKVFKVEQVLTYPFKIWATCKLFHSYFVKIDVINISIGNSGNSLKTRRGKVLSALGLIFFSFIIIISVFSITMTGYVSSDHPVKTLSIYVWRSNGIITLMTGAALAIFIKLLQNGFYYFKRSN